MTVAKPKISSSDIMKHIAHGLIGKKYVCNEQHIHYIHHHGLFIYLDINYLSSYHNVNIL
jgi:hypothetical protein